MTNKINFLVIILALNSYFVARIFLMSSTKLQHTERSFNLLNRKYHSKNLFFLDFNKTKIWNNNLWKISIINLIKKIVYNSFFLNLKVNCSKNVIRLFSIYFKNFQKLLSFYLCEAYPKDKMFSCKDYMKMNNQTNSKVNHMAAILNGLKNEKKFCYNVVMFLSKI